METNISRDSGFRARDGQMLGHDETSAALIRAEEAQDAMNTNRTSGEKAWIGPEIDVR